MRPGAVPRILTGFYIIIKHFYVSYFLGTKLFSKSFTADHNTFTCLFLSNLFLNGSRFIALYVFFNDESNVLLE